MSADFATTRWTLILDAASGSSEESTPALEELCKQYWKPLYSYARKSGKNHQDAQDSTQAFFEHLLSQNLPARASQHVGRFRSFLLTSFRNFMSTEHRDSTRLKRGDAWVHVPLDEDIDQASNSLSAEAEYDRKWAHAVINIALDQLGERQQMLGNGERFAQLRPLLLDPKRGAAGEADLAYRFGISEEAVRTSLSRLRRDFRDIVRAEVARIVDDPADIEDEIAYLLRALRF
jgi:RNA polymerase sigma-70 factor (ECF subfamily)